MTELSDLTPDCHVCADSISFYVTDPRQRMLFSARMIVCPTCGNKRCPKATNHIYSCTDSNEPGQPGSAYR